MLARYHERVPATRIRRATRRDLGAITRIESASFSTDAWNRATFLDYLRASESLFLVAEIGGQTAGYAVTWVERGRAEVDSIAVRPRDRGRGVAQALIKRTFAAVRRRGVSACYLTVRRSNRAAIALYRQCGFRRTRTVPFYYPDGESGWRMRKLLHGSR